MKIHEPTSFDIVTTYPGRKPRHSFLFIEDTFFTLKAQWGKRLGHAFVQWDDDGKPDGVKDKQTLLNHVLVDTSATPMNTRYPIVSYGIYAIPHQLKAKYSSDTINGVIPVFRAVMAGFEVVYAASLNPFGAVRTVPIEGSPQTRLNVQVLFVNEEQLQRLNSQDKEYFLVHVQDERKPLYFPNGEVCANYYLFSSASIPLTLNGAMLRPANESIEVEGSAYGDWTQDELLSQLRKQLIQQVTSPPPEFDDTLTLRHGLLRDAMLREKLQQWLDSACSHGSLKAYGVEQGNRDQAAFRYGDILSAWADKPTVETYAVEKNWTRPKGDYGVSVSDAVIKAWRWKDYAVIEPYQPEGSVKSSDVIEPVLVPGVVKKDQRFVVMGRLKAFSPASTAEAKPDTPALIRVDQTLRNALGIDEGDRVKLHEVRLRRRGRRSLADAVIPPRHLILRVDRGDIVLIEKNACLMPETALQLLGIESGDFVHLEAPVWVETQKRFEMREVKLKAYLTPASTEDFREGLRRAMSGALFQDAAKILGVQPDIPWIYIDEAARKHLALESSFPVRVRASRRHQIVKEFRDFALILLIALLGVVVAVDMGQMLKGVMSEFYKLAGILGIAAVSVILVFWSLRSRLSP